MNRDNEDWMMLRRHKERLILNEWKNYQANTEQSVNEIYNCKTKDEKIENIQVSTQRNIVDRWTELNSDWYLQNSELITPMWHDAL